MSEKKNRNSGDLEELIQKRKRFLDSANENNFKDGLFSLLTDLYPDTAHFIIELLQNAEDMDATVVRFTLTEDCLEFEHNGTKRDFDLNDIDAITSIGHNDQKKEDPTSIGKFGVGFKSVFAYTSSPEIHSGQYHFKILDYFLPEFNGVEKLSTTGSMGQSLTKFKFLFNNPNKPPKQAYSEVLHGLLNLDSSYILFLRNISKIEYILPDTRVGSIEYREDQSHHLVIKCVNPVEESVEESHWLRFQRLVEIKDDKGILKKLPIAVAYLLESDSKAVKYRIVPIAGGGQTFIYFPAEKEVSNLRFHINAPFASTVARDSVRDCIENEDLMHSVAKLVADSFLEIKQMGLLDLSFLAVLPNKKDDLSSFYQIIRSYTLQSFKDHAYLPTREGQYVTTDMAISGSADMYTLFDNSMISSFLGAPKAWIKKAMQNSLADQFIQSLDVISFGPKEFAALFDLKLAALEEMVANLDVQWLKKFYARCFEIYFNNQYILDDTNSFDPWMESKFHKLLLQAKIVRGASGAMFRSGDIYYLYSNEPILDKCIPIVDPAFIQPENELQYEQKAKRFLLDILGIRHYSQKIVVEQKIKYLETCEIIDEQYYETSLSLAKYWRDLKKKKSMSYEEDEAWEDEEIDFANAAIFLCSSKLPDTIGCCTANQVVLGAPYKEKVWDQIAKAMNCETLYPEYKTYYNSAEMELFLAFAKSCGLVTDLRIIRQPASYHPLYRVKLYSPARNTGYGSSEDFSIVGLDQLLNLHSPEIGELIWSFLGKSVIPYHCEARYSPNGSAHTKTCESSLLYYLKQSEWIPDKQGKLHKPADVSVHDLPQKLSYDYEPSAYIWKALGLGSAFIEKENAIRCSIKQLEEQGLKVISEEEWTEVLELRRMKEAKRKDPPLLVPEQMFRLQNQGFTLQEPSGKTSLGSVKDHEMVIEATIKNSKDMIPLERKLFSRIRYSTKQERSALRNWYYGKCQMCGAQIKTHTGTAYFEAINVISTQDLSQAILQTMSSAWNSLCLCPNCAVRYKYCEKDISSLYAQIINKKIENTEQSPVAVTISLAGKKQSIQYTAEHFSILQNAIRAVEQQNKK